MSSQAGTTARALYEQQIHAALTRYEYSLREYTRKTAYNTLVDDLLKAWETSLRDHDRARARQQPPHRVQPSVRTPEAQAAWLRAQMTYDDNPVIQAERRQDLDAYAVKRRTG